MSSPQDFRRYGNVNFPKVSPRRFAAGNSTICSPYSPAVLPRLTVSLRKPRTNGTPPTPVTSHGDGLHNFPIPCGKVWVSEKAKLSFSSPVGKGACQAGEDIYEVIILSNFKSSDDRIWLHSISHTGHHIIQPWLVLSFAIGMPSSAKESTLVDTLYCTLWCPRRRTESMVSDACFPHRTWTFAYLRLQTAVRIERRTQLSSHLSGQSKKKDRWSENSISVCCSQPASCTSWPTSTGPTCEKASSSFEYQADYMAGAMSRSSALVRPTVSRNRLVWSVPSSTGQSQSHISRRQLDCYQPISS